MHVRYGSGDAGQVLTSAAQTALRGAEKGDWALVGSSGSLRYFSTASTAGSEQSPLCFLSHNSSANDTGRQNVATRNTARTSIKGCRVKAAASCQDGRQPWPPSADNGKFTRGQSGRRLRVSKDLSEASRAVSTDSRSSETSRCRFVGFSDARSVAATSQHNDGSASSQQRQTSRQAEHGTKSSCCSCCSSRCSLDSLRKTRSNSLPNT